MSPIFWRDDRAKIIPLLTMTGLDPVIFVGFNNEDARV